MKTIALFDVDKTLLKGYSGYYTALRLIRHGAVRKRRIPQALFYNIISKIYRGNVRYMYETIIGDLAGWTFEDIATIGRECFEKDLRPRLYREGIELVEEHKRQGHRTYLVTAAPFMSMLILGEYLGVCSDFAPGPVIQDGILQKELREPLPYGTGKLEVARLIAEREGTSLDECYFYTDSVDDMPLLEVVGHPNVTNPDKKLERIAKKRQWPILRFESCLGVDGGD